MQQKLPKPMIIGTLASLVTGLITLLFLKKYVGKRNGNIARKAPQLPINNPGTQDDFPKPPAISEIG